MDSVYGIGPLFNKRLKRDKIHTVAQFIAKVKKLDKSNLEMYLTKIFKNPKRNRCMDSGYLVADTNRIAYNSTVKLLRKNKVSKGLRLLKGRINLKETFPKDCKK